MQMGRGRRAAAMLIPTTPPSAASVAAEEAATKLSGLSVADQVAHFRSYASPLAFRLAVYLAPGPFTLPVARLIQAARFGNAAQQAHLAEVLLSGLFYRVTRADSQVAPDWVQYDAVGEAREILLRSLREEDAHHIASILEQHVNRYIAETYGKPADFRALVRDARGQFELPDWAQPFATKARPFSSCTARQAQWFRLRGRSRSHSRHRSRLRRRSRRGPNRTSTMGPIAVSGFWAWEPAVRLTMNWARSRVILAGNLRCRTTTSSRAAGMESMAR
jgi:hypothetical protein